MVEQSIIIIVRRSKGNKTISLPPESKKRKDIEVRHIYYDDITPNIVEVKPHRHVVVVAYISPDEMPSQLEKLEQIASFEEMPKILATFEDKLKETMVEIKKRGWKNYIVIKRNNIDPAIVGWFAKLILELDHYKKAFAELESESNRTIEIMDRVFELAREELRNAIEEKKALERILEFEISVREAERKAKEALLKLQEYRNEEIKDLFEQMDAMAKALEMARQEEIDMSRIIEAQENLRQWTDQEIKELIEENKRLKQRIEELESS